MIQLLKSPLGRFRIIGILEAVSYLLLLGIAMPLKYYAGMPEAVRVAGMVHGILFVVYILLLVNVTFEYGWRPKFALIIFGASLLPFATFYVDKTMLSKLPSCKVMQ